MLLKFSVRAISPKRARDRELLALRLRVRTDRFRMLLALLGSSWVPQLTLFGYYGGGEVGNPMGATTRGEAFSGGRLLQGSFGKELNPPLL